MIDQKAELHESLEFLADAADLAFALRHLNFSRKGFAPLKIDREVARFLVDALTPNRA
jgi:hypothetical protein